MSVERIRLRLKKVLRLREKFAAYLESLRRIPVREGALDDARGFDARLVSPRALVAVLACLDERMLSLGLFELIAPQPVLKALRILSDDSGVLAVVLHGSRAREDASPESDWDFLVLCEEHEGLLRPSVAKANDAGIAAKAFFDELPIKGAALSPVFAEEILLFGRVVYAKPEFLLEAPRIVPEDFFEPFLDPETRFKCGMHEILMGEMDLGTVLEEIFLERRFSSDWPPVGVDLILRYLKRTFSRTAAGLAFWLRPRFATEGACLTPGRRRELFEVLALKGWVPEWSFAVFEVVRDLFEDYDWTWNRPGKAPLRPGELLRLAMKAVDYLAFVFNRLQPSGKRTSSRALLKSILRKRLELRRVLYGENAG